MVTIFVDGEKVLEEPISQYVATTGERHYDLTRQAAAEGKTWRVEVTDPEGDIAPIIFGNTDEMMRKPTVMTSEAVDDLLVRSKAAWDSGERWSPLSQT